MADALCEAGWFGQKTGRGYYLYPDGARTGAARPGGRGADRGASRPSRASTRRAFTHDEILARLLDPMVNEGARILEEGIAARPGDIDIDLAQRL